jgi:hypothetical protein
MIMIVVVIVIVIVICGEANDVIRDGLLDSIYDTRVVHMME